MSVWFAIPSKRPVSEARSALQAWSEMGYSIAVVREPEDGWIQLATIHIPTQQYLGWARSVNLLVASIMAYDPAAEWIVTGGDDYLPDQTKRADEIASELTELFGGTLGVMQPTGDRWSEGRCTTCNGTGRLLNLSGRPVGGNHACPDCNGTGTSAVIDRICGSPWMGREFCRRMYHGAGPLYNGFYHNFADEHLQCVARKLGILWQRRDLIHRHEHWARQQAKTDKHTGLGGDVRNMPEWAAKINDPSSSDWERSKALFAKLKAGGFREADDLLPA
jgi:hypothetical protein